MQRARLAGFGVVLAVGVVARFASLEAQPIWHDEVYTRIFATGHRAAEWAPALYRGEPVDRDALLAYQRLDPARGVEATIRGLIEDEPQHPPAYYVAARAWMTVLGDGIGPLRALSGALGVLLVLAALWLGRELFRPPPHDPRGDASADATLLFGALLAVSPFFVLFAREAREYTAFGLVTLASSAALLAALRAVHEGKPASSLARAFLLYAALTTLGLHTALSHVVVAAAQALFAARYARLPAARVGVALSLGIGALAFLPWALALLTHLDALSASLAWSRQIVVPRSELLAALLVNLARPLLDLGGAPESPLGWVGTALMVALVVAALVHLARPTRSPLALRGGPLVLALFALPLALPLVPDLLVGGIRSLSTRYFVPTFLAALVAVSHRVATLPRHRGLAAAALVATSSVSTLVAIQVPVPWSRSISAGLPAIAEAVEASRRPLVVGDRERHHPGNLLALAAMVGPDTQFLLLDHPERAALIRRAETVGGEWRPAGLQADRTVFLYSPVPELRDALERASGAPLRLVYEDLHVQCWRLDPPRAHSR